MIVATLSGSRIHSVHFSYGYSLALLALWCGWEACGHRLSRRFVIDTVVAKRVPLGPVSLLSSWLLELVFCAPSGACGC